MLILLLFPVWARLFLRVGLLILLWLILLGRGRGLRLPASSSWMSVLELVEILSWVVLMRLLLPLLAWSLIGGFPSFFFVGYLWYWWLVACWIDTPDRSASSTCRDVQDAWTNLVLYFLRL